LASLSPKNIFKNSLKVIFFIFKEHYVVNVMKLKKLLDKENMFVTNVVQ